MGAERAGSPRQEETLESDLAKEPKIPSLLGAQPSHGFGVLLLLLGHPRAHSRVS